MQAMESVGVSHDGNVACEIWGYVFLSLEVEWRRGRVILWIDVVFVGVRGERKRNSARESGVGFGNEDDDAQTRGLFANLDIHFGLLLFSFSLDLDLI